MINIFKQKISLIMLIVFISMLSGKSVLATPPDNTIVKQIQNLNTISPNSEAFSSLSDDIARDPFYVVINLLFDGEIKNSMISLGVDGEALNNAPKPIVPDEPNHYFIYPIWAAWVVACLIAFFLLSKISIKTVFEISASGDTGTEQSKFHFWDVGRYMFLVLLLPLELESHAGYYLPIIYYVLSYAIALSIIIVTLLSTLLKFHIPAPVPSTSLLLENTHVPHLNARNAFSVALNDLTSEHRKALNAQFKARISTEINQMTGQFHPLFGENTQQTKHYTNTATGEFITYEAHSLNYKFTKPQYEKEIVVLKEIYKFINAKTKAFNSCIDPSKLSTELKGVATQYHKKIYHQAAVAGGLIKPELIYKLSIKRQSKKIQFRDLIKECKDENFTGKKNDRHLNAINFPTKTPTWVLAKPILTSSYKPENNPSALTALKNLNTIVTTHLYQKKLTMDAITLEPRIFDSYTVYGTKKQLNTNYKVAFTNNFDYTKFNYSGSAIEPVPYKLPPGYGVYDEGLINTSLAMKSWSNFVFKLINSKTKLSDETTDCKSNSDIKSDLEESNLSTPGLAETISAPLPLMPKNKIEAILEYAQKQPPDLTSAVYNTTDSCNYLKATHPLQALNPENPGHTRNLFFANDISFFSNAINRSRNVSLSTTTTAYKSPFTDMLETANTLLKAPVLFVATFKVFLVATYLFAIFLLLATTVKNVLIAPMWVASMVKQSELEGISEDQNKGFKEILFMILYPTALLITVTMILFILPVTTSILYLILYSPDSFVFPEFTRIIESITFNATSLSTPILTTLKDIVFIIATFFIGMRLFRWMYSMPYKILKSVGVDASQQNKATMQEMFGMR